MIEQRLTYRMTEYWQRLKGERELPNIELFNSAVIQDLWPNCMHLTVFSTGTGSAHYSYEYVGAELMKALGSNIKIGMRATSKMGYLPAIKILTKMDHVIINPEPVTEEGQFINDKNKVIKYRSCLLPFGTDKEHVTDFIVGVSWRAF